MIIISLYFPLFKLYCQHLVSSYFLSGPEIEKEGGRGGRINLLLNLLQLIEPPCVHRKTIYLLDNTFTSSSNEGTHTQF